MDVTQTNDFYRWLKERDSVKQVREQPRVELELPLAPQPSKTQESQNEDNRGVTVIELF